MKYLKTILIPTAVFFCSLLVSVSVYAYTYPYDPETGFDVPYTVVTQNVLREPASVVGEVRETAPDSGVLTLTLPNGNRIEFRFPERSKYWSGGLDGNYVYLTGDEYWTIYDKNGSSYQSSINSQFPLFYKNSLFSVIYGGSVPYFFGVDQNTFVKNGSQYWCGSIIRGLDTAHETLYENQNIVTFKGGYEIAPGSFVYADSLSYIYLNDLETDFMRFESDGYFSYSCDGVNFVNISCPDTAVKLTHYNINGTDSIALKCIEGDTDTYAAYPIEELNELWSEYCGTAPCVYLNGVRLGFEQPPIMLDGTIYVPARFLLESSGADIEWDEASQTGRISYAEKTLTVNKDSVTAYINNVPVTLSAPVQIIGGDMMIPLRAIAESLGFGVEWDQASNSIYITVPVDNIRKYISLFPSIERSNVTVNINGMISSNSLACEGRTMVSIDTLRGFFNVVDSENNIRIDDLERYIQSRDSDTVYELELRSPEDFTWDYLDEEYDEYDIVEFHELEPLYRAAVPVRELHFENDIMPVYDLNSVYSRSVNAYFVCIEECADRMDELHYEWVSEDNTLYIYISDDMVRYDDALKAILDKKGIEHESRYTGDYYKDIEVMQKYSNNDLSALVKAGTDSGIICESDYPDGHLRPTRNISHIDLKRMLSGIGYDYTYDDKSTNKPVTQFEFNKVLENL